MRVGAEQLTVKITNAICDAKPEGEAKNRVNVGIHVARTEIDRVATVQQATQCIGESVKAGEQGEAALSAATIGSRCQCPNWKRGLRSWVIRGETLRPIIVIATSTVE